MKKNETCMKGMKTLLKGMKTLLSARLPVTVSSVQTCS